MIEWKDDQVTRSTRVRVRVLCNKCGRELDAGPVPASDEEWLEVHHRWGYWSKGKDDRLDEWILCEKCYDELTASFKLPVTVTG